MFLKPNLLRPTLLVTVALLLLGLNGCTKNERELTVADGWVRLSPPNSMMTAGYGTFTNTGSADVTLKAFSSPQFADVTLHYTEEVDGTATMREARDFSLAAGESLELAPGGYHLMLMQRNEATPQGSNVEITVELASGDTSTYSFPVTKR